MFYKHLLSFLLYLHSLLFFVLFFKSPTKNTNCVEKPLRVVIQYFHYACILLNQYKRENQELCHLPAFACQEHSLFTTVRQPINVILAGYVITEKHVGSSGTCAWHCINNEDCR